MPKNYWMLTALVVTPATIYASIIDYRERRVPNWLNAALALAGIVAGTWYFGWVGLGASLAGLAVGFGVLIVPWAMHGMGAGDVKLMAAIGAWFGPWLTLVSFAVGALIGGVIAVIMILVAGKARSAYVNLQMILVKCSQPRTLFSDFASAESFGSTSSLLPYGIPLTMGSLLVLAGKCMGWGVLP
ncbi:MAG TPA: A24 family peptidase [Phycisphaerae bacterium]|nr:A24 family peptidase [Phycisphaerae bacterium]